ncbi:MAG: hypothetical protein ABL883_02245 [Terricaulis sp.]
MRGFRELVAVIVFSVAACSPPPPPQSQRPVAMWTVKELLEGCGRYQLNGVDVCDQAVETGMRFEHCAAGDPETTANILAWLRERPEEQDKLSLDGVADAARALYGC